VLPGLELQVANGAVLVEIRNLHGAFVSIVVDHLGAHEPLLLFAKAFEHVIRAHLHDADFVGEASLLGVGINALLIVADFLVATAGNHVGAQGHVLGALHGGRAETTVLVTESLCLAVRVPVIVGLVVSVPLLKAVIQVAIKPVELGHHMQVEGHLGVLVRLVLVALAHGVQLLVHVGVDDLVSEVVVRLLPVVLRNVRRVEVACSHFIL